MTSKIILTTGASTGFGNNTAKILAENAPAVYDSTRDTSGKSKAHNDILLDWAKSHDVNLLINN